MDKLSVMRAYCRIVERGSFVRAAEDLGVSGALLSREIKLLEQSLGCALITRTTRSMSLTEQGRAYYAAARDILTTVDDVDDRIRASARTVSGHLRVNAPSSFGILVITPMLPDFMAAYPDLQVTLSFDDHVIDMVEAGFDLSIRVRVSLPDSSLIARRLGRAGQYLYAAPEYLDRVGTPQRPQDIAAHSIVGFELADHHRTWALKDETGVETVVRVAPRVTLGSSLAVRDLLMAGAGVGTLPAFVGEPEIVRGTLQRVLPGHALPPRHVFAASGTRFESSAAAAAFVDFLQARLAT